MQPFSARGLQAPRRPQIHSSTHKSTTVATARLSLSAQAAFTKAKKIIAPITPACSTKSL